MAKKNNKPQMMIKQKYQQLIDYISAFAQNNLPQCRNIAKTQDFQTSKNMNASIQKINLIKELKKDVQTLKAALKATDSELISLRNVKGAYMSKDQKSINSKLHFLDLLQNKNFNEAYKLYANSGISEIAKSLLEYHCINLLFKNQGQMIQQIRKPSETYLNLKKTLTEKINFQKEIHRQYNDYLQKINDNCTDIFGEERQPMNIDKRNYEILMGINEKIKTLQCQNRKLSELNEQLFESYSQNDELKSSKRHQELQKQYQNSLNKQKNLIDYQNNGRMGDLINEIRFVLNLFDNGKSNIFVKRSPEQMLNLITTNIQQLQKSLRQLGNKHHSPQSEYTKAMINSLNDRLKQLQVQQNQTNQKLIAIIDTFVPILNTEFCNINNEKSRGDLLETIAHNIEKIEHIISHKDQRICEIAIQRENAKNDLNLQRFSYNLQEQDQNIKQSKDRRQKDEYLIQIENLQFDNFRLNNKYKDLQENFQSLRTNLDEAKMKLGERQKLLQPLRDLIMAQQKQIDSLKNVQKKQQNKIKQLDFNLSKFQFQQSVMINIDDQSQMINFDEKQNVKQTRKSYSKPSQNNNILGSVLNNSNQQNLSQVQALEKNVQNLRKKNKQLTSQIEQLTKSNAFLGGQIMKIQQKHQLQRAQSLTKLKESESKLKQTMRKLREYEIQNIELQEKYNQIIIQLMTKDQQKNQTPVPSTSQGRLLQSESLQERQISNLRQQVTQLQNTNRQIKIQRDQMSRINLAKSQEISRCQMSIVEKNKEIRQLQLQIQGLKGKLIICESDKIDLQNQVKESQSMRKTLEFDLKRHIQLKGKESNQRIEHQSCKTHLFSGEIFQQNEQIERERLIKTIEQNIGQIKRTKLLYRFDNLNKVNFHRYVDGNRHIVLVIKTIYGRLIGCYSESEFSMNGIEKGRGMLLPLWSDSVFSVISGKKAITYDDYYLIWGNSQIRLKSLQNKLFSNFGISNGYYNSQKRKVFDLIGENQREVEISDYEVYGLKFENEE